MVFWSRESAKPLPRYRPHKVANHWQHFLSVVFSSTFGFKNLADAWGWIPKHLGVLFIIFWHIMGPTPPQGCASCVHHFNIYLNIIFYAFFHHLGYLYEHWRVWMALKQSFGITGVIWDTWSHHSMPLIFYLSSTIYGWWIELEHFAHFWMVQHYYAFLTVTGSWRSLPSAIMTTHSTMFTPIYVSHTQFFAQNTVLSAIFSFCTQ